MLAKIITITDTDLNNGIANSYPIPPTRIGPPYVVYEPQTYKLVAIKVTNNSGADIGFIALTGSETEAFLDDPSITDLIPIPATKTEVITDIRESPRTLVVKGTGGHTGPINFICLIDNQYW